ncbi:MAG TPA: hypothetical protein VMO81_07570, partial [Aestuariivirgaceae bacterium]|nr:hypothetical protein [Aestuariivirgaceae bacterium]
MATNLIEARQDKRARRAPERSTETPIERSSEPSGERAPEEARPAREEPRGNASRRDGPKPRPANENEPNNAALFARLKRRPSTAPFWFAFFASLLWVFVFAAIYGPLILTGRDPFNTNNLPQLIIGALVLSLPIVVVWTSAYLLWRAQQMRHVSEALVHTALRLIRPQDVATEGLSTISQTVRNEIGQLVGGIEHAVHRASEIEGVVHRELSNLERAFGANEERIRNLLTGLENQRIALRQVGEAVGQQTDPMLVRLEESTGRVEGLISTANTTLAALENGLKQSSGELARTVEELATRATLAGDEIGNQSARIDQVSGVLFDEMRQFSQSFDAQIETLSQSAAQINLKSVEF